MKFTAFIDESVVERWGGGAAGQDSSRVGHRLLIGAAVTSQPGALHGRLQKEAADVLADDALWEPRGGKPEPHKRRARFEKEGFHFVYDSPAIRDRGLKAMCQADVRLHVVFSNEYVPQESVTDLQVGMLFTMVHTLLQRYAGCELTFVFENANDATEQLYSPIVAQATEFLDALGRGRGVTRATALARIGRKPLGGLAVADYALGVVNMDLGQNKSPNFEQDKRLLHRAASHIAHVMDFDRALHRRRFDTVEVPSWARHIVGASSLSGVDGANPILIPVGSTGPFTFWKSADQLATGLGYKPETLQLVEARASLADSYRFVEAKVKGKIRQFTVAEDPLVQDAQRRISHVLNQLVGWLHPSCCAYVPGRGAVDAARPHVGHSWAQRLDIREFFASTTISRVRDTLAELGATGEVADVLSKIMTYQGCLPTGTRTSPMMSNLVLARFDFEIAAWAQANGLTYSRYADDLVFSGEERFDAAPRVAEMLRPLGYELNVAKTRLKRKGQPFRVAGLTIDEGGPRVRKTLKRKLRLELYLLNAALSRVLADVGQEGDAVDRLDPADRKLFDHVRGLARYCIGVEFEWTMALLEKFPLAQTEILGAPKPDRRSFALQYLAAQIRSRSELRLGDSSTPIGARPSLLAAGG